MLFECYTRNGNDNTQDRHGKEINCFSKELIECEMEIEVTVDVEFLLADKFWVMVLREIEMRRVASFIICFFI